MGCASSVKKNQPIKKRMILRPRGLTTRQTFLIRQTWAFVSMEKKKLEKLVLKKFQNDNPDYANLFPSFTKQSIKSEHKMLITPLQRYAEAVVAAFDAAVADLNDRRAIVNNFQAIGRYLVQFGVQDYMFQHLWIAFEFGLDAILEEHYTPEVQEVFFLTFEMVSREIVTGMRRHKQSQHPPEL